MSEFKIMRRTIVWLAVRQTRRWGGRTETLGAERLMLQGVLWRYAVRALTIGRRRPPPGVARDANLPETPD